jgi:hypothetical protein
MKENPARTAHSPTRLPIPGPWRRRWRRRKRRNRSGNAVQKEFERNLNRPKHESGTKGAHPQHKKLDTSKKSESDDFRFV